MIAKLAVQLDTFCDGVSCLHLANATTFLYLLYVQCVDEINDWKECYQNVSQGA